MNKYGALAFTWIGDWNAEMGREAIERASSAGLDVVEIPLLDPEGFDPETFKGQLAEHCVEPYCTLVLPTEVHLPFDPDGAQAFLGLALEKVEALGCGFLGGGPLVIEAFADPPPPLAEAIRMWHPSGADPEALAREGAAFLRGHAERAGLS